MAIRETEQLKEIREKRKEVDKEYEGGLPSYLHDYFDDKEIKEIKKEYYRQRAINKNRSIRKSIALGYEEVKKFREERDAKFWEENKTEIVKKQKRLSKKFTPKYEEPPRADERVEQERELTEEERKVLILLCRDDLYLFAIRYFPHYLKRPSSRFHKFLYKTLSREFKKKNRKKGFKLAIAAPRSHAKSSVVSTILPLWCICYNKKKYILLISDTAGQAEDFLADVKRELENNVKLAQDFPNVVGKGPVWRTNEIITPNEVKVSALGTGSKVRGRRFGVHRPSLVVGDDLENGDMVRSPVTRDFIRYQWFDKDLMFVGGEKGTATDFLVVGTILGKDSLLNALLDPDQYPEWHGVRFQSVLKFSTSPLWDEWERIYKDRFNLKRKRAAWEFFKEHEEEMLEGTEVLWPEGDPYYDNMVYKITNPSGFAAEKQNYPIDPTKIYVTTDDLHWENFSSDAKIKEALKRSWYFGAIDPSLGKKSTKGDYSAIVTIARDPKTGFLFVVSINLRRRSVDQQIIDIIRAHERYNYRLFAIETNAFQYVLAEGLRKESRKSGIYVPTKDINQYQDKKMRFEGVLPFITDGTVVFDSYKYRYVQEYNKGIEQLCTFTGENDKEDDFVDALGMCIEIAKKPRYKLLTKRTR